MVKNFGLAKRIDNLSNKINDPNPEEIIHIDFDSFSDAERILFQKVDEIEEEWQKNWKRRNSSKKRRITPQTLRSNL